MKVRDRMTVNVKTIQLDSSINDAFKIMNENSFRRLPVMNQKQQLVAIVTLSDLNQASPSNATALSVHELNYLLARTKIKDILPAKPELMIIGPDEYIEAAANVMIENKISSLPVVENGELVGIITETDIFHALVEFLGVKKPHTRIDAYVADQPGRLAEVTGLIASRGINILNTQLYYDEKLARYKVIMRIDDLEQHQEISRALRDHGYEIESIIVRP